MLVCDFPVAPANLAPARRNSEVFCAWGPIQGDNPREITARRGGQEVHQVRTAREKRLSHCLRHVLFFLVRRAIGRSVAEFAPAIFHGNGDPR